MKKDVRKKDVTDVTNRKISMKVAVQQQQEDPESSLIAPRRLQTKLDSDNTSTEHHSLQRFINTYFKNIVC